MTTTPVTSTQKGGLEPLTDEVELKIKADYLEYRFGVSARSHVDRVRINHYFGTYNNSVVVKLSHNAELFGQEAWVMELGSFSFFFPSTQRILVWKDGMFYELPQACGRGWITEQELGIIHSLYTKTVR
jgi:hypothetical protein